MNIINIKALCHRPSKKLSHKFIDKIAANWEIMTSIQLCSLVQQVNEMMGGQ